MSNNDTNVFYAMLVQIKLMLSKVILMLNFN